MDRETCALEVDIQKKLRQFDLDVQFRAGIGCLGILGPSGCGKSMTLKSIAGIVRPDGGKISLHHGAGPEHVLFHKEKRIDERPQLRRVGYLFQNYALFPNMTVEQNIAIGLGRGWRERAVQGAGKGGSGKGGASGKRDGSNVSGKSDGSCVSGKSGGGGVSGDSPMIGGNGRSGAKQAAREKVQEMIGRFRLEGLEKQYPSRLSGGQQQRVALARILAYEPEVLLLDEPFSAMDAFLREKLRLELAQGLKAYQKISILVTHDRDEAFQLCDYLLLLSEGKVLTAGKTREVFADPKTPQAARLTGCKNISRILRLGSHRVRALDWEGLELTTEKEVGEEITHIGIRAHDFVPVSESQTEALSTAGSGEASLILVEDPKITEMPFEWYITLKNGLWWKVEKDIHTSDPSGIIPRWLRVAPSAIVLLREGQ